MRGLVRGLTIVLVDPSPGRMRGALTLAAAQAALGARARIFWQGDAVTALAPPIEVPDDDRHIAAGLPTLARLIEEALGLDVELIACQSGLALAGLDMAALDPRIAAGGPITVLQSLGEDRLLLG